MLPIVNKNQRRLFIIGVIASVVGVVLFESSLITNLLIQNYELTGTDLTEFYSYLYIFYSLLISGLIIMISGWLLLLYTRHPYYEGKWIKFKEVQM